MFNRELVFWIVGIGIELAVYDTPVFFMGTPISYILVSMKYIRLLWKSS